MDANLVEETRREQRWRKKQDKIAQHGKSLGRVYRDAILKRLKWKKG